MQKPNRKGGLSTRLGEPSLTVGLLLISDSISQPIVTPVEFLN